MKFKKLIFRWILYKYLRYKIHRKNWIDAQRKTQLNQVQLYAINIFKKAVFDSESLLLVDRLAETSYIHIPARKLFIKLEVKELTITNSKYNYFIQIPEYEYKQLINIFDKKLTKIRRNWELSMLEKTTDSLSKLLSSLTPTFENER